MTKSDFRSLEANSTSHASTDVFSCAQVRAIEDHHRDIDMMRRAGRAAFEFLRERTTNEAKIVLLVGPGNNGGDALACAAELAAAGYAPTLVMRGDPARFGADAKTAFARVSELGIGFCADRTIEWGKQPDWIVDGLFGIGLQRPISLGGSEWCQWCEEQRAFGAQVLALDVPSGINADTGALVGDTAVVADHTITFIALKPGLLTGPALDHVGELHFDSLGLELAHESDVTAFGREDLALRLRLIEKLRRKNDHKGTHGTLAIIGGANGMLGAALLASRAGMRSGVGKVKVGWLADPFPQVDPLMPEVMMTSAKQLLKAEAGAWLIGCGMGMSGQAARALKAVLALNRALVVDADALNLIAESADLAALMKKRSGTTIITPHPTEAARLLGRSTPDVQSDRIRAARDLAKGYRCIAVLKGAGTVISDGENTSINRTGNPLLASAGTGDVLAGMIGALLARGHDAMSAAQVGVAMHGAAADTMRERGVKHAVASDVIDELRNL
jgi:ADP-dependent NAD(P)H-hydrate dehydratase / NAD(P)H-hydrate epimerase